MYPIYQEYQKGVSFMRTNIIETNDTYILKIEMPGFKKEDININLENDYLIVEGSYSIDENLNYLLLENPANKLSRKYYLGQVKPNEIKASLDSGILTIQISKPVEEKKEFRKIQIN